MILFSSLEEAIKFFSREIVKGIGVSRPAHLITGASRYSKQFSMIMAAISPPRPPNIVSSCKTNALPVFLTELIIADLSSGTNVLRSII